MRRYRMFFWMAPAFALMLSFAGNAVAGPNADAVVTLDIVTEMMMMNQTDDGVTTATVADSGTTIEVEVFVSGVTTDLVGVGIFFDSLMVDEKMTDDNGMMGDDDGMMGDDDGMMGDDDGMMGGTRVIPDIVKVVGQKSDWPLELPPEAGRIGRGVFWVTLPVLHPPFTVPESGYLGTLILETQTDVTGMPFSLRVAEFGVTTFNELGGAVTDTLDVSVVLQFNAAVPAVPVVMIPDEAADGVAVPSGGESEPVRVTAEGFAEGATLTWHVETTGTGATIDVLDDEGSMMEGDMFPSTSTFIDVKATGGAGGDVSVEVWAESDGVETNRVTIVFNAAVPAVPAVMIPDEAADGVAVPSGGESEPVRVTAEGFAEGATLTWHVETTGTGATIDVLDDEGSMMEGDMFPSTSTFIDVKATGGAGGDVSVEVWAESDSVETNRVTILFNAAVPAPAVMIPDEAMGGVPVPQGGESEPVRVTAEGFAEGATLTWHVETTGTGATIDVLDDEGSMMEGDMFPSTSTFIDVKATDAGGDVSVEVWAESDSVETNRVTIMFSRLQPVELASFGGALIDDRVVLNWTTASQTNNAGWRVLRSVDGETYEQVGEFVTGAGTSDALQDYAFQDGELPLAEKVFYVLEQIDLDGTARRSDRVEMLLGARFLVPPPTEFAVGAYPNPFNPSTTVTYDLPSDQMVSIVIYDAIGQEVRRLVSAQRSAGRYTVQWDARDSQGHSVGSGVYIAKIEAGPFSASQKMLLLK